MPIGPKECMEKLNLKEQLELDRILESFDLSLSTGYSGGNFTITTSPIYGRILDKVRNAYIQAGWRDVKFDHIPDQRDGDFMKVTFYA